jgi:hypothetical protein
MPIPTRERLDARRVSLLQHIAAAATAADSTALLKFTDELRSVDTLLAAYATLDAQARALLDGVVVPAEGEPVMARPAERALRVPGRAHGVEIRTAFLKRARARGLNLAPENGAIFMAPGGVRVGIAVATERQPDRWFLGLADGGFDAAVLVCKGEGGDTFDLCLPRAFIARHASALSRSGGQVKFNVVRRGGRVALTIPTVGSVNVDGYVGAIDGLAA